MEPLEEPVALHLQLSGVAITTHKYLTIWLHSEYEISTLTFFLCDILIGFNSLDKDSLFSRVGDRNEVHHFLRSIRFRKMAEFVLD